MMAIVKRVVHIKNKLVAPPNNIFRKGKLTTFAIFFIETLALLIDGQDQKIHHFYVLPTILIVLEDVMMVFLLI